MQTGEPVGSKLIAELLGGVSSATIRNDMSFLELSGLLHQPHTSSGRLPTQTAYRVYIDRLLNAPPVDNDLLREIDALFNTADADPDRILTKATDSLSDLTGLATISATFLRSNVTIRSVEVMPASPKTLIIIVVASSGVVRNKVCRVDFNVTDKIVDFFTQLAASQLKGRTVEEVTSHYLNSLMVSMGEYGVLFTPVLTAIYSLIHEISKGQYCLSGHSKLLGFPELSGGTYELLTFLEQPEGMRRVIMQKDSLLYTLIGTETGAHQLSDCAVTVGRYPIGRSEWGAIAVVSPVRANYPLIMPLIAYFSHSLTRILTEIYSQFD